MLGVLLSFSLHSQDLWTFKTNNLLSRGVTPEEKIKTIVLDANQFKTFLDVRARGAKSEQTIDFPNELGNMETFVVVKDDLLSPELAKKHPDIGVYRGISKTRKGVTVRWSYSPHGINAMLYYPGGYHFIQPKKEGAKNEHLFYKREASLYKDYGPFECLVKGEKDISNYKGRGAARQYKSMVTGTITTYRLAVATTGEFTQFWGDNDATNGTNKQDALANIVSTINRVNQVFEVDFGVRFQLVSGEGLIYDNSSTDPFTGSGSALLAETQQTIDTNFGTANYDVGHLFTVITPTPGVAVGVGLAALGALCAPTHKANAYSARFTTVPKNSPNDIFDITVAHELGHQFGASHTFSHALEGAGLANVEPGSGSTIMGYPGGGTGSSVQNIADYYFHSHTISQVKNLISMRSCGTVSTTTNNIPTVSAGANISIPMGTAYELTATATDTDNDALTYCWEQVNSGEVVTRATFGPTLVTGPQNRSFPPTSSPKRTVPSIAHVLSGRLTSTNPRENSNEWETVSTVSRTLRWAVTVRDRSNGMPSMGQTAQSFLKRIYVYSNSGPFSVTSQNTTGIVWRTGAQERISWDVANTNTSPINTNTVSIYMSTDGGQNFNTLVVANTPNDGSYDYTIPSGLVSTNARLMIRADNNIYFAVNSQPFTIIDAGLFSTTITPTLIEGCGATSSVSYNFALNRLNGFTGTVSLSLDNISAGVTYTITPPMGSLGTAVQTIPGTITLTNLVPLATGTYTIDLVSQSGSVRATNPFVYRKLPISIPVVPTSLTATNVLSQPLRPAFSWQAVSGATSYTIELSPQNNFSTISVSSTLSTTTFAPTQNLERNTLYYWRVRASNSCGVGNYSATQNFRTLNVELFSTTVTPTLIEGCGATSSVSYNFTLNRLNGFTGTVSLSLDNVPTGVTYTITPTMSLSGGVLTIPGTITLTNLVPLATGTYTIDLVSQSGSVRATDSFVYRKLPISIPAVPTSLTATNVLSQPLRPAFSWQAVSGATSYTIELSRQNNFSTISVSSTLSTTTFAPTQNLERNTLYYFRVRASNSCGVGNYSATQNFRTLNVELFSTTVTPTLIEGCGATSSVSYNFTLNRLNGFTGTVSLSLQNVPIGVIYTVTPTMSLSGGALTIPGTITLTNLVPLATGTYTIYLVSQSGSVRATEPFVYRELPISIPAVPTSLTATNVLSQSLRPAFSWQAVSGATSYTIELSRQNNFSTISVSSTLSTTTFAPAQNLERNTLYYWRVRASNSCGVGNYSATQNFRTLRSLYFNISITPPLIEGCSTTSSVSYNFTLNRLNGFTGTVSLSLDNVSAGVSYTITPMMGSLGTVALTIPGTITLTNLASLNTGTYTIDLVSRAGSIRATEPFVYRELPAPAVPTSLIATNVLSQPLRPAFSWQAVSGATSYTIELSPQNNFSTISVSSTLSTTTFAPTQNLERNTMYYWRVRASNSCGMSNYSVNQNFRTLNVELFSTTVTPLLIEGCGATSSVSYNFTLNRLSGFTGTVSLSLDNAPTGVTYTITPTMSLSGGALTIPGTITLTNLVPLATGTYTIDLVSQSGSVRATDSFVYRKLPISIPAVPTSLTATNVLSQPLRPAFSWQAVSGATSYTIELSPQNNFSTISVSSTLSTTTFAPAQNLERNTLYYWRVRASNSCGMSNYSATQNFRTLNVELFSTTVTPLLIEGCGATSSVSYNFTLNRLNGFTGTVSLSLDNAPTGVTYTITPTMSLSGGALTIPGTITLTNLVPLATGTYTIDLVSQSGSVRATDSFVYRKLPISIPAVPTSLTATNVLSQPLRPAFSWQAVSGATSYTIELSPQNNFSTISVSSTLSTTTFAPTQDLDRNTLYYWRVRASNSCGMSNYSATQNFRTLNVELFSIAITPPSINGCGATSSVSYNFTLNRLNGFTGTVSLSLSNVPAGVTYTLTPTMSSLSAALQTVSGQITFNNLAPLPARTYTIYLVSQSGSTQVSKSLQYQKESTSIPSVPTSLTATNVLSQSLRPTFSWQTVAGAAQYFIEISKQSNFSPILVSSSLSATNFTPTQDLERDTTYYWRVSASNSCGSSGYSTVQSFKTINVQQFNTVITSQSLEGCRLTSSAELSFTLNRLNNFSGTVSLSLQNVPAGVTYTITPEVSVLGTTTSTVSSTIKINGLSSLAIGVYTMNLISKSGSFQENQAFTYNQSTTFTPATPTSLTTTNVLTQPLRPTFRWQLVPRATQYRVELSKQSNFSTIVVSSTINTTMFTPIQNLEQDTTYYWRVMALSNCQASGYSAVQDFKTVMTNCAFEGIKNLYTPIIDAPISMTGSTSLFTRTSVQLPISFDHRILDIGVEVSIITEKLDMSIALVAPDGTVINLSSVKGSGQDFNAHSLINTVFDQSATTLLSGGQAPYTGSFRPEGDLNNLIGKSTQGKWTLQITNRANNSNARLTRFNIKFCLGSKVIADDDSDGYSNNVDNCPTMANKDQKDSDFDGAGDICDAYPNQFNNIIVSKSDETCANRNNGIIEIQALKDNYEVSVKVPNGDNKNFTFTETSGLKISNLSSGVYEVCVRIPAESYERCFKTTIGEPQPLSVSSFVNERDLSLTLLLSGSEDYNVVINNEPKRVLSRSSVNLNLREGLNVVEVKTDLDCQGVYKEEIYIAKPSVLYPNPAEDLVYVLVGGKLSQIDYVIYNVQGNALKGDSVILDGLERRVAIDMSDLSSGNYFIKIYNGENEETIKFIKR